MIDYPKQSKMLKALAHPVRLRMAEGLLHHECHVDKMVRRLGLPQSTVSQHLGILKHAGLVAVRKDGVKTCYRIIDKNLKEVLDVLSE